MKKLFPYQRFGAEWLTRDRFRLLADEMGLGKSAQAITAANLVKAKSILVVCPAVGIENWKNEFQEFSAYPFIDLHVHSYEYITKHGKPGLHFDVLIIDEIHYCKGLESKRSRAVLGVKGVVRQANYIWCLSGTPAPNHPGDLWPILYTFGYTSLKYENFLKKYCECYYGNFGLTVVGAKKEAIPELREKLEPFMLRRNKSEVLKELPPISYGIVAVQAHEVDLDVQMSMMKWVFPNDRRKELEGVLNIQREVARTMLSDINPQTKVAGIQAVAQSVATLRRYTGLQKVQSIVDLVTEELTSKAYEKLVIFAIHRDVIEGLRSRLTQFNPVTVYGGTDPQKKQKHVDMFQGSKRVQIFIGNIMAAGTSITLTAAHQILFAEIDWVPGNNAQAAMRCHRIGQGKPVTVRFAVLSDSIDDKIARVVRNKTADLTQLFDPAFHQEGLQLPKTPVTDKSIFT